MGRRLRLGVKLLNQIGDILFLCFRPYEDPVGNSDQRGCFRIRRFERIGPGFAFGLETEVSMCFADGGKITSLQSQFHGLHMLASFLEQCFGPFWVVMFEISDGNIKRCFVVWP